MARSIEQSAPAAPAAPRRGARREAILEATLRLLVAHGPSGVTHRAVAREAGVPLAATTYYFASKEDLLLQALQRMARADVERLEAQAARFADRLSSPEVFAAGLAEALLEELGSDGAEVRAKFQVYLEASARPVLRASTSHWIATFTALAEHALAIAGAADPEGDARLLVAAVDGMLLHALASDDPEFSPATLGPRLERLVQALLAR